MFLYRAVVERSSSGATRDRFEARRHPLRRRLAILLSAIAGLLVLLPVTAEAAAARQGGPKVTVMTRNVFLGADPGRRSERRPSTARSTEPA
jgi:hypothetical protein